MSNTKHDKPRHARLIVNLLLTGSIFWMLVQFGVRFMDSR